MHLSTHYYILSLSDRVNMLFECFRDTVIDVRNHGFPMQAPLVAGEANTETRLHDLMRAVDQRYAHYHRQDPLRLIIAGDNRVRAAFETISEHRHLIIGSVDGDYTTTAAHELGQIVWPVVKEAMSGVRGMVYRELENAERTHRLITGLEDVGWHSDVELGGTLLVEEDYHVRGTMRKVDQKVLVSESVDVREVMDDVVDKIIDKVLQIGGSVVFMSAGSLRKQKRIALIPSASEGT